MPEQVHCNSENQSLDFIVMLQWCYTFLRSQSIYFNVEACYHA